MSFALSPVSPARPGAIADRQLDQLTHIAHSAPQSLCTEAEAEWLIWSTAALLEELRRWRSFGAQHGITVQAVNVIELRPAR